MYTEQSSEPMISQKDQFYKAWSIPNSCAHALQDLFVLSAVSLPFGIFWLPKFFETIKWWSTELSDPAFRKEHADINTSHGIHSLLFRTLGSEVQEHHEFVWSHSE